MINRIIVLSILFSGTITKTMNTVIFHQEKFNNLLSILERSSEYKGQKKSTSIFMEEQSHGTVIDEVNKMSYGFTSSYYVKNSTDPKTLDCITFIQSFGELEDDSLEITSVETAELFRNKGYGSYLLKRFLFLGKQAGYKKVNLYSTPQALRFYRKLGFDKNENPLPNELIHFFNDEHNEDSQLVPMYKIL